MMSEEKHLFLQADVFEEASGLNFVVKLNVHVHIDPSFTCNKQMKIQSTPSNSNPLELVPPANLEAIFISLQIIKSSSY